MMRVVSFNYDIPTDSVEMYFNKDLQHLDLRTQADVLGDILKMVPQIQELYDRAMMEIQDAS
jgi:hypothetical protein